MKPSPKELPLVVIVGETASGKSALAMELARRFDGELISADSWSVYRGFDIGTAKPSARERSEIPQHVLDVADPADGFSAPQFKRLAEQAMEDIWRRGKLPIVVGGTGLYVDSLVYDYTFLPTANSGERDVLNTMTLDGLLALARERGLDTSGVDERNKRRVIRLIENDGAVATRRGFRPNTLLLGIRTERAELLRRVEGRVDAMLAAGLENEVKRLVERYGWEAEPMKGIGYREWRLYFAGTQTWEQTKERIVTSTMQLAKKQRTWFKRNQAIRWVSGSAEALTVLSNWLMESKSRGSTAT